MIYRALSFLNCPRCGVSVRRKVSWLTVEYGPRRMAVNPPVGSQEVAGHGA
jgi:hypothetical protein